MNIKQKNVDNLNDLKLRNESAPLCNEVAKDKKKFHSIIALYTMGESDEGDSENDDLNVFLNAMISSSNEKYQK